MLEFSFEDLLQIKSQHNIIHTTVKNVHKGTSQKYNLNFWSANIMIQTKYLN